MELLAEVGAGTGVAECLKLIMELREKATAFGPNLESLTSTLERISPVIRDVKKLKLMNAHTRL